MSITIQKTFSFDAAHRLHKMLESHPCHSLHGHTYSVTVYIEETDSTTSCSYEDNMVVDFRNLGCVKEYLDNYFDHATIMAVDDEKLIEATEILGGKTLIIPVMQTTCECLSEYLYEEIGHLLQINNYPTKKLYISVSETPSTKATYKK